MPGCCANATGTITMPAASTVKKLRTPAKRLYDTAATRPSGQRGRSGNGPRRDPQLLLHLHRHQPHEHGDDRAGDERAGAGAQDATPATINAIGRERCHQEQRHQEQQEIGRPGAMRDEELGGAAHDVEQRLHDGDCPEACHMKCGQEKGALTPHRGSLTAIAHLGDAAGRMAFVYRPFRRPKARKVPPSRFRIILCGQWICVRLLGDAGAAGWMRRRFDSHTVPPYARDPAAAFSRSFSQSSDISAPYFFCGTQQIRL